MTVQAAGDGGGGTSIRTVLVPLDLSPAAASVFGRAVEVATAFTARLHLLRVVTIDPAFPPAAHVVPDGLEAKLLADGMADLDAWRSSVAGVQFGPPRVVIGDPWRQILAVSRELDAELIVIGSHRYHGVDRLLGTVASRIVNHADRDVMVVRPRRASPWIQRAGA